MTTRRQNVLRFLLTPGALWLLLFFIIPAVLVVVYSVLTRRDGGGVIWQFSLEAYKKLFSPTQGAVINDFALIFFRSLWWAVLTSAVCLLFGYPLAFFIVLQPPARRNTYLFLVLIPFWTNFLVRTYAWKFILNNNGLLNIVLEALKLPKVSIINTTTAVLIGLVYGNLPFMVLPLYASIEKLDFTLIEAAQDLGANYWRVLTRVVLPVTLPGIIAGSILVFIPVTGQYIVPAILGGGKVAMLGTLLAQQFGAALNWPFGSAVSVIFMLVLTAGVVFYLRSEARREDEEATV